jgi:hypothetical protein
VPNPTTTALQHCWPVYLNQQTSGSGFFAGALEAFMVQVHTAE